MTYLAHKKEKKKSMSHFTSLPNVIRSLLEIKLLNIAANYIIIFPLLFLSLPLQHVEPLLHKKKK